MASFVDVSWEGMDEQIEMLGELPQKVEDSVFRPAIRKCCAPLLQRMKETAPVQTGYLKANLRILVAKSKSNGQIIGYVGIPRKQTQAQATSLASAKADASRSGDWSQVKYSGIPYWVLFMDRGYIDRGGVHHPGSYFIENAGTEEGAEAGDIFETEVIYGVGKELEKYGWQT